MAKQIIVTQNDYGIELETQFVDDKKKPLDITDYDVRVKIIYDDKTIDTILAGHKDSVNGIAYIVLEKEHLINAGLHTSVWSVVDEDEHVTAQENVYYFVKDVEGSEDDTPTTDLPIDADGVLNKFNEIDNNLFELTEQVNVVNEQLEHKASKEEFEVEKTNIKNISAYVTPKTFGCIGDGVTDDSVNLQKAIDYCILNNKKLVGISGEKYGIKQTLIINGFLDIDFSSCEIIDITDVGLNKMLNIKVTAPTVYPKDYYSQNTLILNLQGNGSTNYGVYGEYARNFIIDKTVINNVSKAIEIYQGYEVTIRDFYGCGIASDNSGFGVKICTGDCLVDSAILLDYHTGVWTLSNNYIENVHCWLSRNFNGSIAFRQTSGDCHIDNCYFDSYNYVIYKEQNAQLFINNMRTFYNTDLYTTSFNVPIIFYSSTYPTNVFGYTSLTNSYIKSSVNGTKLHNVTNFVLKEVNNSFEIGSYDEVNKINIRDVILEGDCVNSIGRSIQKRLYDSVYTRIRLKSESGFTHNKKIATVPFPPNDTIYLPCIVSDNSYVASGSDASTVSNGVITIDTYGGVYYYNPSGITRKYLFANGVYDIKTY